jgi:hypothetical protein
MPKRVSLPKPRLMRVALEARMKPDLRRFSRLHEAAASRQGYPDWESSSHQVRVIDRVAHRSITITNHDLRFIQDGDAEPAERDRSSPLPLELFHSLQTSTLERMGHRRWYLLPLEMSFHEAVALFHLRYYPQEDPMSALGHDIDDVLYRVDTSDPDGCRWHITFAPVPRSQAAAALEYDYEAHWQPNEAPNARIRTLSQIPEVALYLDLDCYRQSADMPLAEWEEFVERSNLTMTAVSTALFGSFVGEE